jgi:hypothetical protein
MAVEAVNSNGASTWVREHSRSAHPHAVTINVVDAINSTNNEKL